MGCPARFFCPTCPYVCHIETKVSNQIILVVNCSIYLVSGFLSLLIYCVCSGPLLMCVHASEFTGKDTEKAASS